MLLPAFGTWKWSWCFMIGGLIEGYPGELHYVVINSAWKVFWPSQILLGFFSHELFMNGGF